MSKQSTIYYMVGVPGSGKSTFAAKLSQEKRISILSADKKLEDLQKEGRDYVKRGELFDLLAKEAYFKIKKGQDLIWDATGLDVANRRRQINHWKSLGARIEGFLMVVSEEITNQRNLSREKKVPQNFMDKYFKDIIKDALDTEFDKFDEIKIVDENGKAIKVYNRELAKEQGIEVKVSPKEFTPRRK